MLVFAAFVAVTNFRLEKATVCLFEGLGFKIFGLCQKLIIWPLCKVLLVLEPNNVVVSRCLLSLPWDVPAKALGRYNPVRWKCLSLNPKPLNPQP